LGSPKAPLYKFLITITKMSTRNEFEWG